MLDNPDQFPLWEVSFAVFFAIPMLIMLILYGRMGLKIRSRTRHTVALGECFNNSDHIRNFNVKILCLIIIYSLLFLSHPTGVQQGSIHGESKQTQSRRAIIRMLGKIFFTTIQL